MKQQIKEVKIRLQPTEKTEKIIFVPVEMKQIDHPKSSFYLSLQPFCTNLGRLERFVSVFQKSALLIMIKGEPWFEIIA